MTRQQADSLIDQCLKESKEFHYRRIRSLETGLDPIKTYINSFIFQMKLSFKMIKLKSKNYFMWRELDKAVKNREPFYLSRHYYRYYSKTKTFDLRSHRFLGSTTQETILSFKRGDENYKIMLENDKKRSKKYKRLLNQVMLNRFIYINLLVIKKTMEITERITKKKIEYLLGDEAKRKDILDG